MNWIFKEIRESVRLYFLPVTNPRKAWKMLCALTNGESK